MSLRGIRFVSKGKDGQIRYSRKESVGYSARVRVKTSRGDVATINTSLLD